MTDREKRIAVIRASAASNDGRAPSVKQLCQVQFMIERGDSTLAISARVGLTLEEVESTIKREGWAVSMQPRPNVDMGSTEPTHAEFVDKWRRSVAAQSRHLVFRGFDLAEDSADKGDAVGFSCAARGVKSFVDMARQAEGMDANTISNQTINLYVARVGDSIKPVDIVSTPVKEELPFV